MSSNGGDSELEADLWLSDPYIEMISDVVSRGDDKRPRSSLSPLNSMLVDGLENMRSLNANLERDVPLNVAEEGTGPMENKPMSPVSVVVFSMLSRGPGDRSSDVFSLTLRRGRVNGGRVDAVQSWGDAHAL